MTGEIADQSAECKLIAPEEFLEGTGVEFSEVRSTDAIVHRNDLVGDLGQGWEIARTTLSYERGATALARMTGYRAAVNELLAAARTLRRRGRALIDDPVVRNHLGRIVAELEVNRYAALRMLSSMQRNPGTGPHASMVKLSYSEFEKRLFELALEILGPYGQLSRTCPKALATGS
jgi:alkylation response protein AidB-like acyl-CoA dehydrogenase